MQWAEAVRLPRGRERGQSWTPLRQVSEDRWGLLVEALLPTGAARALIRILPPDAVSGRAARRRWERSIATLRYLRHPNLVSVVGSHHRPPAIIYEWVGAESLASLLSDSAVLDLPAALVLLDDCLAGLDALHGAGLSHGNVSARTVVVERTGVAMLRDAGVRGGPSNPASVDEDIHAVSRLFLDVMTPHRQRVEGEPDTTLVLDADTLQPSRGRVPAEVRGVARALFGARSAPAGRSAAEIRSLVEDYARAELGDDWRRRGRATLAAAATEAAVRHETQTASLSRKAANRLTALLGPISTEQQRRGRLPLFLGVAAVAVLIAGVAVFRDILSLTGTATAIVAHPVGFGASNVLGSGAGGPAPTTSPSTAPTPTPSPTGTTFTPLLQGPGTSDTPKPRSSGGGLATQVITFNSTAPSGAVVGGPEYTVSASGGPSGQPVMLSVFAGSRGICAMAGQTVSFIAVGTCTIEANQAGNSSYNPARPVTQSFSVGQGFQAITFTSSPSSAVYNGSYTVTAFGGGSGNPVTFTASGACQLSSGTTVSFPSTGTCTIDANQLGNANYHAAPTLAQSFTVNPAAQSLAFTSNPSSPVAPGSYTVSASGGPSGNPVVFSQDSATTNNACSVGAAGNVTFNAAGTCVIDANQAGNADYAAAPQISQVFTVLQSQSITFTSTPPTCPCSPGQTYVVTATASSGEAVTFSIDPSSASGSCSLAGNTVTLNPGTPGACIIDANQPGDSTWAPAPQVQQTIQVS